MKFATWNVNSLNVRLPRLLEWLAASQPDVIGLRGDPARRCAIFPTNQGLCIDHILLFPALAATCTSCRIDRQARKGEKPPDHAPVIASSRFSR